MAMDENDFDILELVEEIATEQADHARQRGIQVTSFADPQLPRLWKGNSRAISHALNCLVRSAMSQLTTGAVVVEVLETPFLTESKLRFAVSDSRTNLAREQLEAMRLSLLELDCEGGRLKDALESVNATLVVDERVLARTARFYFVPQISIAKSAWLDYPLVPRLLQSRFFLVANDPYPNRSIQRYCRHHGLRMDGAPTASEALSAMAAAALTDPYEVMGIAPPIEDMGPYELAELMRKSDNLANTKLFYVAAQYDEEDARKALEAGFDGTLAKPFRKDDLFMTLAKLVGEEKFKQDCPSILIVDDNLVNQKVARYVVQYLGFEAVCVINGQEALSAVEHGNFAAVLMDLQMPGMDGIQTTRMIRQSERLRGSHIPIIALTANDGLRQEALNVGCDEFLVKPASTEEIKRALARHLPTIIPGSHFQAQRIV